MSEPHLNAIAYKPMSGPTDLLPLLKLCTHTTKQLAQIHAQAITRGTAHSTLTWNCLIRAYSNTKSPLQAILIYNYLTKTTPLFPDNNTLPSILKACSRLTALPKGKEIHARVMKIGLDFDIHIQNSLIHMYGNLTRIDDARQLFDEMPQRDLVSWNTILSAYVATSGSKHEALVLFEKMVAKDLRVDAITMVILLSACAQLGERDYGRIIHVYIIKHDIRLNINLANSLLSMYAGSGAMDIALWLYREMDQKDMVSSTIMINGYVISGLIDHARGVFDQMPSRDLVSWNSMIRGYVKCKRPNKAFKLFRQMWVEMVRPNEITIVSVLSACAILSDLQFGRWVHLQIVQIGIKFDVFVGTALIDMYSKCGSLEEAVEIFYQLKSRDIFAWTSIIAGFADYGRGKEALSLFSQMQRAGTDPNEATFVAFLTACSRSGLVCEGLFWFDRMIEIYKISPRGEHFGCIVDLLSRAGMLNQAEELIKAMPIEDRIIAYKTMVGACIVYSDFEVGEKAATELIKLGSCDHGVYILLSNFYALAGKWENVAEMRRLMKVLDLRKEAGFSCMKVKNL